VLGWGSHVFTVAFALISLTLQMFISYERYARYLKWLTLVLLAYVAVVFVVKVDWQAAALGLIAPRFPLTSDSLTVVVAIFGTTISPYLMFWQSSQEVEEIEQDVGAHPLAEIRDLDFRIGQKHRQELLTADMQSHQRNPHRRPFRARPAGRCRSLAAPTPGSG